jgi:hypothetical protein
MRLANENPYGFFMSFEMKTWGLSVCCKIGGCALTIEKLFRVAKGKYVGTVGKRNYGEISKGNPRWGK